jgi:hypothetical protein
VTLYEKKTILVKRRYKEEFEDTMGVIRIRISKKNRHHNGQKKKPFLYQPGYQPQTTISARDAVEHLNGSRDDSRDDMEKVMF